MTPLLYTQIIPVRNESTKNNVTNGLVFLSCFNINRVDVTYDIKRESFTEICHEGKLFEYQTLFDKK